MNMDKEILSEILIEIEKEISALEEKREKIFEELNKKRG